MKRPAGKRWLNILCAMPLPTLNGFCLAVCKEEFTIMNRNVIQFRWLWCFFIFTGIMVLALRATNVEAAIVLSPVEYGCVRDNPVDGNGDTFYDTPFIGNSPTPRSNVYSAILEYDVGALSYATLSGVTIRGRIYCNNYNDTGERIIELFVFSGNGVVEITDFQIFASSVGTVSYYPFPDQVSYVDFSFDVLSQIQPLLDSGASYIGVRFEGQNEQAPSNLDIYALPRLTLDLQCDADFDLDHDVDGSDLAVLGVNNSDLAVFARDFGRTDCK